MTQSQTQAVYKLEPDQKVGSIMIYTATGICWGDVIVRDYVRISTWLRTNASPDIVCLHNARLLITTAPVDPKPMQFPQMFIATAEILAYHLTPPAKDPIDYDPSEPNRRMDPVSAILGVFRVDGLMRLSTRTDLARYLDMTHETFSALYEADISSPVMPTFKTMRVPFVLIRQAASIFANRAV